MSTSAMGAGGGRRRGASAGEIRAWLTVDTRDAKRKLDESKRDFQAHARDADKAFKDIGASASRSSKDITAANQQTKRSFADVTSELNGMGLQGTAALASVALAIQQVVSRSMNLEQAIADVKAVSGATNAEMKLLTEQAGGLARAFGGSQADILRGSGEMIKAGAQLEDVLNGGAGAMVALSKATDIGYADSAEFLSRLKNTFKEIETFDQAADLLANTANGAAASMNDLKLGFANAGNVANAAGVGVKDLSTAIGILTNTGLSGQEAGTAYKVMLQQMVPTTEENIKLFKKLGLLTADNNNIFFDSAGKMKSLADIVGILQQKFGGFDRETNLNLFTRLFGSDASRAALGFMEQGREKVESFQRQLSDTTAMDVAKAKSETLQGSVNKMKAEFDQAAISFGDNLIPVFQAGADTLASLANGWKSLDDGTKAAITTGAVAIGTFTAITLVLSGIGTGAGFVINTYRTMIGATMGQVAADRSLQASQTTLTTSTAALTAAQNGLAAAEARTTAATAAQTAANAGLIRSQAAANAGAAAGAAATSRLAGVAGLASRALGGIGLVLTVVGTGYAMYKVHTEQAAQKAQEFAAKQAELNAVLRKSPLSNTSEDVKGLQERAKALQDMINDYERAKNRIAEINAEIEANRKKGWRVDLLKDERAKMAKEMGEARQAMQEFGVETDNAREVLDRLNSAVEKSIPAMMEMRQAEVNQIAEQKTAITQMENYKKTIDDLSARESLNAEQKDQLRAASEGLARMIPSLVVEIDAEGRAHVKNIEIAGERIKAENDLIAAKQAAVIKSLQLDKERTESERRSSEARLKLLLIEAETYRALADRGAAADWAGSRGDNHDMRNYASIEASNERAAAMQQEVNYYTSTLGKIQDSIARVQKGDFSGFSGPTPGSKSFDIYDTGPEKQKKGKDLEKEVDQARRESYERDMAYAKRLLELGYINEQGYADRLKDIKSSYTDWLQKHYDELYQIEGEISKNSFQHSMNWIESEKKAMEDRGATAQEIAQMEVDAWERVASRDIYLAEDRKRAQEELRRAKHDLVAASFQHSVDWIEEERRRMEDAGASEVEIQEMVLAAWQRVSDRKIYLAEDQKRAQQELADAQREMVRILEDEYRRAIEIQAELSIKAAEEASTAEESALQAKLDGIGREREEKQRLLDIEKARAELAELEANRAKVAADKRFELIERDSKTGELIQTLVADLPRLEQLDKQIADQKQRIVDMQREEDERKEREKLDNELRNLRDTNSKKLTALRAYWDEQMNQERITQAVREKVNTDGLEATKKSVQKYLDEMVTMYKATQAEIMAAGGLIGGSGSFGNEAPKTTSSVVGSVAKSAGAIVGAVPAVPAPVRIIGEMIKRFPIFHDGTEKVPGAPGEEVPAVLEAGERVISAPENRRIGSALELLPRALSALNPLANLGSTMQNALSPVMDRPSRESMTTNRTVNATLGPFHFYGQQGSSERQVKGWIEESLSEFRRSVLDM